MSLFLSEAGVRSSVAMMPCSFAAICLFLGILMLSSHERVDVLTGASSQHQLRNGARGRNGDEAPSVRASDSRHSHEEDYVPVISCSSFLWIVADSSFSGMPDGSRGGRLVLLFYAVGEPKGPVPL